MATPDPKAALNIRNIVLLRPVTSMIEFKQIIGGGNRLFDGKDFFMIIDFVKAYEVFNDPGSCCEQGVPVPPAPHPLPPAGRGCRRPRRPGVMRRQTGGRGASAAGLRLARPKRSGTLSISRFEAQTWLG